MTLHPIPLMNGPRPRIISTTCSTPSNGPTHRARATEVTAYLKNGDALEKAARMTNHASMRTTRLYAEDVTLDEVEGFLFELA
jgi:hypothetical protein